MKTGTADSPLHYGKAPRWLFARMRVLAGKIAAAVVLEHGTDGFLQRLADPYWFQALGCVLGFDWHSSGLTTTTCGAIKDGIKGEEESLGLFAAGGKGATSRKTPVEVAVWGDRTGIDADRLIYASRTAAKVDSAAVQDGYAIYHHAFFFDRDGNWAVVQQGMNAATRMARRYHWLSEQVSDFVCEPHAAVCCDVRAPSLNLVARDSAAARTASAEIAREPPDRIVTELARLKRIELPRRHAVILADIDPHRLHRIFLKSYAAQPAGFEELLTTPGVGAKTLRALSLIAELVYGAAPSFTDPARFSFAHGGKDGTPFPVDRAEYDRSIAVISRAIRRAKLGSSEELRALRRLERAFTRPEPPPRAGSGLRPPAASD